MNESALRNKVRDYLKNKDGWYRKIPCNIYLSGIPDFIGSINGRFIAIELKRDNKGKLTKLQEITIKEIKEKGGGISFVAYGWSDFIRKFEFIYEEIMKWKNQKITYRQKERKGQ